MKISKRILVLCTGVLCIVICACIFLFKSKGGQTANRIDENIGPVPYLKDGSIYYYQDGVSRIIAKNSYDASEDEPIYSADYAIDKGGRALFVTDDKLYLADNGESKLLISEVRSWRVNNDFSLIAFTTGNSKDSSVGALYMSDGNETKMLDTSVDTASIKFSPDGKILYALKPNSYPQIKSKLMAYDFFEEPTVKCESVDEIKYISPNSGAVICGTSSGITSDFTVYDKAFKKSVKIEKVFYPSVSSSGKYAFFLKDYDKDELCGTLVSVNLNTLKIDVVANKVSFFSSDGVTDSDKGILYSVCDSEDSYSIYYKEFSSKPIRLMHATTEKSLYNIAVNCKNKTAYALSVKNHRSDSELYFVDFSDGKAEGKKIFSGYIDSLEYYQCNDSVSVIVDPESEKKLYLVDCQGNSRLIGENVDCTYDNTIQKFTAKAIFSNSTESCIYFENDALKFFDNGNAVTIDECVESKEFFSPIPNGDLTEIIYCKNKNLFRYYEGKSELIAENIDGFIDM